MSLLLDTGNFKDAYINGQNVRELYFRGERIYVKKVAPSVTIEAKAVITKNEDGTTTNKIQLIGQFVDRENAYRYYDEAKISYYLNKYDATHAFVIAKYLESSGTLTLSTATSRVWTTGWSDSEKGIFRYNYKPAADGATYYFRAVLGFIGPNGKHGEVYSDTIKCSFNSLSQ